jgi:hypothetical protein
VGGLAIAAGGVVGAGALAASATFTAAWVIAAVHSGSLNVETQPTAGPRPQVLAEMRMPPPPRIGKTSAPVRVASASVDLPESTFDAKWARAMPALDRAAGPPPVPQAKPKVARVRERIHLAELTPPGATPAALPPKPSPARADNVPLPRAHPARREVARAPAAEPALPVLPVTTIVAAKQAAPPPVAARPATVPAVAAKPVAAPAVAAKPAPVPAAPTKLADITGSIPPNDPQPARNRLVALPSPGSKMALYDISARTVYMPNGEKLEAHSGLGDKMDNPRYANVRMRGVTPPNVYDLTMRESLFHGVQAIRLNPVNEDKMFGRDGILAHTYMLGPSGQSNGCVSFKNYAAFLHAVQRGEVERLVVVASRGDSVPDLAAAPSPRIARARSVRSWRVADTRPAVTRLPYVNNQW